MIDHLAIAGRVEVLNAERRLDALDTILGRRNRFALLIDLVVLGHFEGFRDLGKRVVRLGSILGLTRDDQWRACLIDQDRVDLIDDREGMSALHRVLQLDRKVVPQIVETEFGISAIRNVAGVGRSALLGVHTRLDNPDRNAEHLIQRTHPQSIAAR